VVDDPLPVRESAQYLGPNVACRERRTVGSSQSFVAAQDVPVVVGLCRDEAPQITFVAGTYLFFDDGRADHQ
jgi:hypothetical protein